jgi:hypothetical protein
VVEGKVEGGKLKVIVHDPFNKRIIEEFKFNARA